MFQDEIRNMIESVSNERKVVLETLMRRGSIADDVYRHSDRISDLLYYGNNQSSEADSDDLRNKANQIFDKLSELAALYPDVAIEWLLYITYREFIFPLVSNTDHYILRMIKREDLLFTVADENFDKFVENFGRVTLLSIQNRCTHKPFADLVISKVKEQLESDIQIMLNPKSKIKKISDLAFHLDKDRYFAKLLEIKEYEFRIMCNELIKYAKKNDVVVRNRNLMKSDDLNSLGRTYNNYLHKNSREFQDDVINKMIYKGLLY